MFVIRDQNTGEWDAEEAEQLGIVKPSTVQGYIDNIVQNAGNPHGSYYGAEEDALGFDVTYYDEAPVSEEKRLTLKELRASCHDAADALTGTGRGQSTPEPGR